MSHCEGYFGRDSEKNYAVNTEISLGMRRWNLVGSRSSILEGVAESSVPIF